MSTRVRLLLAVLLLAATACSSGSGSKATTTPGPVLVTLPPGPLVRLVLQPEDVAEGFVVLPAQSGPAGVAKIASYSADATAARRLLIEHGFVAAYTVEYLEMGTGRFIVNVVSRFKNAAGAERDLAGDLAAKPAGTTPVPIATIGDESGAQRAPYPQAGPNGEVLSVRFRVGATTALLSLGGRQSVSDADAATLAGTLAGRITSILNGATATPSP